MPYSDLCDSDGWLGQRTWGIRILIGLATLCALGVLWTGIDAAVSYALPQPNMEVQRPWTVVASQYPVGSVVIPEAYVKTRWHYDNDSPSGQYEFLDKEGNFYLVHFCEGKVPNFDYHDTVKLLVYVPNDKSGKDCDTLVTAKFNR